MVMQHVIVSISYIECFSMYALNKMQTRHTPYVRMIYAVRTYAIDRLILLSASRAQDNNVNTWPFAWDAHTHDPPPIGSGCFSL